MAKAKTGKSKTTNTGNNNPPPPKGKQLPTEKKIELSKEDQKRYHNLLEELEAVCRHYATVDAEKTETNKTFKEELSAITKRKEGILKSIDTLKRPLPLFSGKPLAVCKWTKCSDQSDEGSDYCKKHDKEVMLLNRQIAAKNKVDVATKAGNRKPATKKKATPKKKK